LAWVRIVQAPIGPAPLTIRQAWIGCILPVADRKFGSPSWWLAALRFSGRETTRLDYLLSFRFVRGYPVRVLDAIEILEIHDPVAARWWRENTPHLIVPRGLFLFDSAACQEVASR
jgi:hypothetical protein